MDIKLISKITKLCYENYDEKTMKHALRVAEYALDSIFASSISREDLYITALCHDLIEDTNVSSDDLANILKYNSNIAYAISLLTKPNNIDYINYIKNIKASKNQLAYCVKLADMKDHLTEKATLTSYLKDKYDKVLPYLL